MSGMERTIYAFSHATMSLTVSCGPMSNVFLLSSENTEFIKVRMIWFQLIENVEVYVTMAAHYYH